MSSCQNCGARKGCDCMESYLRLQKAFGGMAIVEKQSVAGAGASVMRVMCRNECLDGGCKSKFCRENGKFSHFGDWDFKEEEYKANILAGVQAKVLRQNRMASEHRRRSSRSRSPPRGQQPSARRSSRSRSPPPRGQQPSARRSSRSRSPPPRGQQPSARRSSRSRSPPPRRR
jgi:hypothetical protein